MGIALCSIMGILERGYTMNYHEPYVKMAGAAANSVEELNNIIGMLITLREEIIARQREAEDIVVGAEDAIAAGERGE
jgi:hypothetical protein